MNFVKAFALVLLGAAITTNAMANTPQTTGTKSTTPTKSSVSIPAKSRMTIFETAEKAGEFKTLVKALNATGLSDTFKRPGHYTVFAPTDRAFAQLPKGTLDKLMKPEGKQELARILKYHVIDRQVGSAELKDNEHVKTLEGDSVVVRTKGGARIENARITKTDIPASNGTIHVIDTVLMPKK